MDEVDPPQDAPVAEESHEATEYRTLANGHLNPRHRRFCQLVAEGRSAQQIADELGYVESRISVLKKHPVIVEEVKRLQDRIFEGTIESRMKSFADSALTNVEIILKDKTNRVKTSEKMALSQWVIEKLDGKATQKIEAGENLLRALMDRLDAKTTDVRPAQRPTEIDVTPRLAAEPSPHPDQVATPTSAPDDELAAWIAEFTSTTPSGE